MKPSLFAALLGFTSALLAEPRSISGIYPSLAMFNNEGECGTGAVVPWADRLWVITYAPHMPKGSSDKLYEITPALEQIIRPESVGGTPANRMIHPESNQLFIGPYVVDAQRNVRVITPQQMFGRLTGLARHLTDPAGKIVYATMEEGIYEVDVKTLAVTELWADEQRKEGRHADLPGYHGKGFYSAQGRYVYANNGDHAKEALRDPSVPSGVLAQWNGKAKQWTVVRRNQFTDVTGPGGIEGSKPGDPLWAVGWDHRSLILMVLDEGKWHAFRLPKSSHSYDGAHGWNTEWPRIREIGEDQLLMTMHGAFWKFPKNFSAIRSSGIVPRSNYLKVIGDFCRWQDRIVLGCDDSAKSEFLNKHPLKGDLAGPGQSQSNLWLVSPETLDHLGPVIGRGSVWLNESVKAGVVSDPYMFSGYDHRSLVLSQSSAAPLAVTLEVDRAGNGTWEQLTTLTVPAHGTVWHEFSSEQAGAWVRLTPSVNADGVTAAFQYRNADTRSAEADARFSGLAKTADEAMSAGVMLARGDGKKTLRYVTKEHAVYDLDADLKLAPVDDAKGAQWTASKAAMPEPRIKTDAASVLYVDGKGKRWRLPKGGDALPEPNGARVCREICTERNLLNAHGTFYELPAENAGGFIKIRPVTTHNRWVGDFTSYRGLFVMSGVAKDAKDGDHIIRSTDGKMALWAGAVDDMWSMGKPRGKGSVWLDTDVKAGEPSDAYLATGYDKKVLTLSASGKAVKVSIEADFTGTGDWKHFRTLDVPADAAKEFTFPTSFGAYWLRLKTDADCKATATFVYE